MKVSNEDSQILAMHNDLKITRDFLIVLVMKYLNAASAKQALASGALSIPAVSGISILLAHVVLIDVLLRGVETVCLWNNTSIIYSEDDIERFKLKK